MLDFFDALFRVVQGITGLVTLLIIFVKPFRLWIFNVKSRKKAEEKKDNERDEALRCTLRNIITQFYYSHRTVCELHQYEYENIAKIYKAYKDMGGNSFIYKLWEEIQEWTIIP